MREGRVKRSCKKVVKEGCEINLEIGAGRIRRMIRAEKRRKILADSAMVQSGGFAMKQSIVVALFLLLQGAGIGHVSANPYPSCLLYTSPSPRDLSTSRMPSSA